MTIHSFEGIMILVVIYALTIVIFVLYALWRRAEGKLKAYYRSGESLEESEPKGKKMSNPMADAIPIICGIKESVPKASVERIPKNTPPNREIAILFRIASMLRKLIMSKRRRQSIKSRTDQHRILLFLAGFVILPNRAKSKL